MKRRRYGRSRRWWRTADLITWLIIAALAIGVGYVLVRAMAFDLARYN
jgi:hypothetical protein